MSWTTTPINRVFHGAGSVKRLPEALKVVLDGQSPKALIITGRSLATKTPVIKGLETLIGSEDLCGTFNDIGQHAPIQGIRDATKLLSERGGNVIVSCGGGSPIDSGKAIANQYKKDKGASSTIPHIAIPTTLSAAEFTMAAGFTDESGNKTGVGAPDLPPRIVILDPELSRFTPQRLWLSSGIRALDHGIENLYRASVSIPLRHLAVAAIVDLFTYLPKCKADEADLDARDRLQQAAWMSLWPSLNPAPLGLSHGLGYALGSTYSVPHGICSCLTLAAAVRVLVDHQHLTPEELVWLASAYDKLPSSFRKGSPSSDTDKVKALADAIDALIEQLGLKSTLAEYKVPKDDLPKIAEKVTAGLEKAKVRARPTKEEMLEALQRL